MGKIVKKCEWGKHLKLTKDERSELWSKLNGERYHQFRTPTKGVWQITSSKKGPHLWIVGAVHGNEAVGAVVISELLELALSNPFLNCGQLTLVIGNPSAFLADQRYIDQDLNRAFAEDLDDITQKEIQRKKTLSTLLKLDPPTFVLDLHSVSRGDHGIIVYPEESQEWAKILCCLDVHFCYSKAHMAGETLIDAAQRYGAGVMVVECGHHHSPNTKFIAFAHIQKLFRHFQSAQIDLVEALPKCVDLITRYRSKQMIKPNPNFKFILPVETGTAIDPDVIFAEDDHGQHKVTERMWLMMPSLEVKPHDQDAGWLCIRELLSRT